MATKQLTGDIMTAMHDGLTYWTADEVAECLSVSRELSGKLWGILSECENKTPLGGDGTDGTMECPGDCIDDDCDDIAQSWWDKLTPEEQQQINAAYLKDYPED